MCPLYADGAANFGPCPRKMLRKPFYPQLNGYLHARDVLGSLAEGALAL